MVEPFNRKPKAPRPVGARRLRLRDKRTRNRAPFRVVARHDITAGMSDQPRQHIHFVTGSLAADLLKATAARLAARQSFSYSVQVMPISVAALMKPDWIARRIAVPPPATQVMVPGYCGPDLSAVAEAAGIPVIAGPKDVHRLGEFLGADAEEPDLSEHDIEIIAEINHCPRMTVSEVVAQARRLAAHGADVIDVGCVPGERWSAVGQCVRALRDEGLRVSIDSFEPWEVETAVAAGAELVLSVNQGNVAAACGLGAELVAIPDDPPTLAGLEETVAALSAAGKRFRIDPILEPIGCGFAASLGRYLEVRRRYADAEMMMGVGNLTELTDVDSAGVNMLLIGFCQEAGIRSVLTTEVINWARTSVREIDAARRLARYARMHGVPPKRLSGDLVMLRDEGLAGRSADELQDLAAAIRDPNYRIFAEEGLLWLMNNEVCLTSGNPFQLFLDLMATGPGNVDASHAFYLGYELAKAHTALALGKQYQQDQPLDWGLLTQAEEHVRLPRRHSGTTAVVQ